MYDNYYGKRYSAENGESILYPVLYHSLDVAAVGYEYLSHDDRLLNFIAKQLNLDREEAKSLVCYLLSIHDIGKFSYEFQQRIKGLKNIAYESHTNIGFSIWSYILNDIIDGKLANRWSLAVLPVINATLGHHGVPIEINKVKICRNYFTDEDKEIVHSFICAMYKLLGKPRFGFFEPNNDITDTELKVLSKNIAQISWLIAGFVILCDWIGSNINYFNCRDRNLSPTNYFNNYARVNARKALLASGVLPSPISTIKDTRMLFPDIADRLTPLQKYATECTIESTPQLVIMEDIPGSGKTEASEIYAYRGMQTSLGSSVFFALPTMATTNPMYERFTNIYKLFYSEDSNPSLVLAHSGNRLFEAFNNSIYKDVSVSNSDETASAQCNSFFADNRKKALLADVGVGTIDQVVMSILPTKHQAIRMFGLSRNILIVDEVHTYDPYMNALLCKTLKLHASNGGSAILLSATLPINIKQQFVDSFRAGLGVDSVSLCDKSYPLFTYVDKSSVKEVPIVSGSKQKKIDIEFVSDLSKIEEKIIGAAHEGKCVCWIRNTVDDATEAYKRICDVIGFDKTYLSHAHFMMGDRQTIESDIIARFGKTSSIDVRRGRVVIATQILEQSLDIDFDYMVSDLAPIDVLIQRFGRLQRHERPEYGIRTPLFTIFSPEITDEPSDDWYRDFLPKAARYIYPCHGKLWLTARILNERKSILIPDDLRLLIEYVYGDQANDSIPESLKKHEDRANRIMDRQLSDACITSLNLTKGYSHASSGYTAKWYNNDKLAPTRYGEDTILVRFVKLECGKLTSFYPDEQHQWELSQASISTRQIASVQITDKNLNDAVTRLKAEMRDKGKFAEIIPLESEQAGEYKQADGVVIKNKYDVNVNLSYSKTVGFSIKR